jgi:nucleoside-diphosphate-sugar epimerase
MTGIGRRHPIIEEDLREIVAAELPWERLHGKTVLVTGANGFVPAYLVETLLKLNEMTTGPRMRIIGLVRNVAKAETRFAAHRDRSDLEFAVQDVCDPLKIDGRIDFIIHAASQATPKVYGTDPVGTLLPNTIGTRNLLERARQDRSESVLFISGGEVYGHVPPEQIPTGEQSFGRLVPTDVRACYAESKRMGETMCVAWHHQYGVPARMARLYHTYGPGMSLTDGRVFADFVADILQGRDIVMKSDGSASRTFCYLADATLGFFTLLLRGEAGQAYNLGEDREEVSILQLAERLVRLFPEKAMKVVRAPQSADYLPSPIARHLPDITRIRCLGWSPVTTLEAGFLRTVRSFT